MNTETMKTVMRHYRFDRTKAEENTAYIDLLENTLKKIGFPVWTMDLRHGYTANPTGWQFMDKIRKCAGNVTLETEHLFDDQWNASVSDGANDHGLRLFNWAECLYSNRDIKEGYWLEQTTEMAEILRNTHKCGYCGKQEAAQKGYVFCPHCPGSAHLDEASLHLTRMLPVDHKGNRKPLSEAERAYLLPIWKDAQLKGNSERSIAHAKRVRERIEKDYKKAIEKAEAEYKGFSWLLGKGFNVENVIYYSHTNKFSFGWKKPVDAALLSDLLAVISEFPFDYEIKCADGKTLSNV